MTEWHDASKKTKPQRLGEHLATQGRALRAEGVRRHPDGRRKRISVYGATWDEADAERTRVKDPQRKGIPVDSTTSTVAEYMLYWLVEIAQPSVRATTFSSYELLVRRYIVPGLGKRKLRALQAQHVRTWLAGLRPIPTGRLAGVALGASVRTG